jgi:FkbM family methyltransferase
MELKKRVIKEDLQKKYLKRLTNSIMQFSKIYAWGAGRGGKKLLSFLNNIEWDGQLTFIDNNTEKWDTTFENHRIIGPSQFFYKEYDSEALILVTCADVQGVLKSIRAYREHNYIEICDITSIDFNSKDTWFDFIWEHIEEFSSAYELLDDDKSKNIMAGLLNYRISRDPSYIKDYVEELDYQYFEKEFVDIRGMTIADCGAYTGDTIESIVKISNGDYKTIYCFEPDKEIFKKLNQNIKNNKWPRIKSFNIGNYSCKKTLRFTSTGNGTEMSNHIDEDGNLFIEADSLDNVIEGKIDLIKMDIEGAEYDALLGAKKIIKKYHPVLAICIYHKRDDYYRILKEIHSIDNSYKLHIRQYAYNDNETILYAI